MPGQVEKLIADLKDTYAPSSVYLHSHTLKTILTFVDRTHRTYLAGMVPRVPPAPQRHVIASEDEVKSLLLHATTWQRALILFARGMGLRRGEITHLTPRHYDPVSNSITFNRKQGGTSDLPVPPELKTILQFAADQDPYQPVLITLGLRAPQEGTKRIKKNYSAKERYESALNNYIDRHWSNLLKRAGITRQLHIHDLRHTIATEAYEHTKDLRTVQQLLGHRSMQSTMKYIAPVATEALRKSLSALNHGWLYKAKPQIEIPQ
jgi:integrase